MMVTSSIALILLAVILLLGGVAVRAAIVRAFRWVFGIPGRLVAWNHRRALRKEELRQAKLATETAEERLKNEEIWTPGNQS